MRMMDNQSVSKGRKSVRYLLGPKKSGLEHKTNPSMLDRINKTNSKTTEFN